MKVFIGIDNGVSGSITAIDEHGHLILHENTPVKQELSFQKTKAKMINRIDVPKLEQLINGATLGFEPYAVLERPLMNSMMFQASISAARALEATLIVLEEFKVAYRYIDSKEWQGRWLPPATNKAGLKIASDSVALRLYPTVKLCKAGNGDSVIMAHHLKTVGL